MSSSTSRSTSDWRDASDVCQRLPVANLLRLVFDTAALRGRFTHACAEVCGRHHDVVFPNRRRSLGAIILAAGSSSRMGRPKMLLPWGDTTVLGHLIAVWSGLPAGQIAVVCAPANAAVATELDRLRFPGANRITNPDPGRGMFSSLQCAAHWAGWSAALTHWAVILGDQPHLRPATLIALADFAARHPQNICQPARRGHARHPVILPAAALAALKDSKDETLKGFLQREIAKVKLLELDDPGLDLDLDLPADYEKARRLAFGG